MSLPHINIWAKRTARRENSFNQYFLNWVALCDRYEQFFIGSGAKIKVHLKEAKWTLVLVLCCHFLCHLNTWIQFYRCIRHFNNRKKKYLAAFLLVHLYVIDRFSRFHLFYYFKSVQRAHWITWQRDSLRSQSIDIIIHSIINFWASDDDTSY